VLKWVGTGAGLPLVILIIILKDPEKFFSFVDNLTARFAKLCLWLSRRVAPGIRHWADKKRTAAQAGYLLNSRSARINSEFDQAFPHRLRVQWVSPKNAGTAIRDGEVIVCLNYSTNWDENIVRIALHYVKTGFLPRAKLLIDHTLRQSMDFVATEILVDSSETISALRLLREQELPRIIQEDLVVQDWVPKLEETVGPGFFTRVLLRELQILSRDINPLKSQESIRTDIRAFIEFLYSLSVRSQEEDVPLVYLGKWIQVGFLLVANKEILAKKSWKPYVRRLTLDFRSGCNRVYVTGRGEFVKDAHRVVDIARENKVVSRVHSYSYFQRMPGRGKPLLVALFACEPGRKTKSNEEIELEHTLCRLLPTLKETSIERIVTDREKRTMKIAIHASEELFGKIVSQWVAARKTQELPLNITFVRWADDPESLIVNALAPLKKEQVANVEFDDLSTEAVVTVLDAQAMRIAIGRGGVNVQLAEALTGWDISVKVGDPEEHVRQVLLEWIAPIREGKVKVVAVARRVGIGTKVLLASRESSNRQEVMRECFGTGSTRRDLIKTICSYIGDRNINFILRKDDIRKIIVEALYPLRARDVVYCQWDKGEHRVILELKSLEALERARGENDINLQLAQELLKVDIELRLGQARPS